MYPYIYMRGASKPRNYLEKRPSSQTVYFLNKPINLRTISRLTGISQPHLSYVFSGKRGISVKAAEKVAHSMEMNVGAFLDGLRLSNNNGECAKTQGC